jgi:hypothetical protein
MEFPALETDLLHKIIVFLAAANHDPDVEEQIIR